MKKLITLALLSLLSVSAFAKNGIIVDWTTTGGCAEFTYANVFIRDVSISVCRKQIGSLFDYIRDTNQCAEFTGGNNGGTLVMLLPNSYCEKDIGVVKRR